MCFHLCTVVVCIVIFCSACGAEFGGVDVRVGFVVFIIVVHFDKVIKKIEIFLLYSFYIPYQRQPSVKYAEGTHKANKNRETKKK